MRRGSLAVLILFACAAGPTLVACALSLDGFSNGNAGSEKPDGASSSSSSGGEASSNPRSEEGVDGATNDATSTTGDDGASGSPSCVGAKSGIGSPMVRVLDQNYCMDATEVTLDQYQAFIDSHPAIPPTGPKCTWKSGYTLPAFKGASAIGNVDWCDAYGYCQYAGKRLCGGIGGAALNTTTAVSLKSEWHYACTHGGDPSFTWPYGNAPNPQICLYGDSPGSGQSRPVASNKACVGPDNVFDLSGNVWEWEDACDPGSGPDQQCNLRGGGFLRNSDSWGSCAAVPGGWTRESHVDDTGIRCCSDWR